MPILYQNNKPMQPIKIKELMSQQEAKDIIYLLNKNPMDGYLTTEANNIASIVKTYIDALQRSCAHCGTTGNLRDAKDKLYKFYTANKEFIDNLANPPIVEDEQPSLQDLEDELERLSFNEESAPKKKSTYKSKKK